MDLFRRKGVVQQVDTRPMSSNRYSPGYPMAPLPTNRAYPPQHMYLPNYAYNAQQQAAHSQAYYAQQGRLMYAQALYGGSSMSSTPAMYSGSDYGTGHSGGHPSPQNYVMNPGVHYGNHQMQKEMYKQQKKEWKRMRKGSKYEEY